MNANLPTIACIGLPGSGKSAVGRQLARRLNARFYDSDKVIEHRIGCSVREYFEREGEESFRDIEETVIAELSQLSACILSTGGGSVLRTNNRQQLRRHTQTVYLHSSPEEVYRRLRQDQTRPLLQVADPLARLKELYEHRDPIYRQTAHFVIETGKPTVVKLAGDILLQLQLAGVLPQI